MTNLKLFKTGTKDNYTFWYVDENPICDVCHKRITDNIGGFIADWSKEGKTEKIFHLSCASKAHKHPLSVTQNRLSILFSDVIPPKSIPVLMNNPIFVDRRDKATVFEPDKVRSESVTDKAWRSKTYPSLEGAQIGDPLALEKIEEDLDDRQKLLDSDPDAFLKDLKSSGQRSIEQKNKRLLE